MKKLITAALCVFTSYCVDAQSYIGYFSDNYSGVNSVVANPANITDSRFKADINLAGASAFLGNDYYGVNILDATKEDYDFNLNAIKSPSTNNNANGNLDILGPAFMFNLTKNSSLAIFTRARLFFGVRGINGTTVDVLDDDTTPDAFINEGDFNGTTNAWGELGFTYARTIFNEKQHFLKAGLTVKYLQGAANAYANGTNVTVNYDADGISPTEGSVATTGELVYGNSENLGDDDGFEYDFTNNANGFGADLGVVYEWRPNYKEYATKGNSNNFKHKNKYKLKLGLSITDIGSINYKDGSEDGYNIDNPLFSENDLDNAENEEAFLNSTFTRLATKAGYTVNLPTALHVNADWSFTSKLYVNLNTDISLISNDNIRSSRISNVASVTPRFESRWLSFYLPLSVVQYNGFQAGAGLRAGPLYVGSGSIISALTSDNSRGADVYAGLKIPIYQGAPRDRDNDGVIDKVDDCPKVAGPIENNGCPWGDKDNDTVLDNEDGCPEQAGPAENKGCPWKDTDGDTVLDNEDGCITVAGPVANNGCPWKDTDGDGVYDKDDKCKDTVGTVANNGCPEITVEPVVTAEVQKVLNQYAKTILFNSGRSTIKIESTGVLQDIVQILQEYPSAKFSIEGHTDSSGSAALNQKLSDSRANAVKKYLIEKGIDPFRLSSRGFGEDRPITSNATSSGRAQNRRVEINLAN